MKKTILLILILILSLTIAYSEGIDSNTVLMLHADGDDSNSNHTYTANGNPQLISNGKFDGAIKFDGSDYLRLNDNSGWDFGTDAFTIDTWIYASTSPSTRYGIYTFGISDGSNDGLNWYILDNDKFYVWMDGTTFTSTLTLTYNEWVHISLIRDSSNNLYVSKNGAIEQLGTTTKNVANSAPEIGRHYGNQYYLTGYLDEFRVTKGVARWTANFTPDTTAYEPDANTNLLLHFDGDVSDSNHTITFNGDMNVSSSTYKFDGSYYFDGDGDYISVASNDDFNFDSENFTIDFWAYPTDLSTWQGAIGLRNTSNNYGLSIYLTYNVNAVSISWDNGGVWKNLIGDALQLNSWNHIAIIRDSNGIKIYQNGLLTNSTSNITSLAPATRLVVGYVDYSDRYGEGYLDEIRITKGIARWTSNFTPDTTPYTVEVSSSPGSVPTFTEFTNSETTNFSDSGEVPDITNVTEPVIATSAAKIEWSGTGYNLSGADLNSAIQINDNFVSVNSATLSVLNATANVTLKTVSYPNLLSYDILRNGVVCSDCVKYSSNPVKFQVSGFSNYTTNGTGIVPEFSESLMLILGLSCLIGIALIKKLKK